MQATGTFKVDLQPLDRYAQAVEGLRFGRMSIDKTFAGELEATSQGEMLSLLTTVEASAGYVALEQVRGTLQGKRGTFALQHYGISQRGKNRLILEVVPDSGTGELAGLSGRMTIRIEEGQHLYEFDYTLEG